MRRAALVPLLALLLLLCLPAGHAGTAQQPEVADKEDDAGVPALDLRAMWFTGDDRNVTLNLRVDALPGAMADTAPCADPGCAGLTFAFQGRFRSLAPDGSAAPALPGYAATILEFRWGYGDDAGAGTIAWVDDAGQAFASGPAVVAATSDGVALTVPRNATAINVPDGPEPGRYRFNATQATSSVLRCNPEAGDVPSGCAPVDRPGGSGGVWDRAPDAGLGLDYVFRAPPSADWVTVTATVTQTDTVTQTVTATQSEVSETLSVITQTATPFPRSLTREGLPGPGIGVLVVLALAAILLRRSL